MKTALVACALVALTALVQSAPHDEHSDVNCTYYINGDCALRCEEGTHFHTTDTDCGYLMPERTCDNPNPTLDTRGRICDYIDCECDEPKVRDTTTRKCVLLEECPKKTEDGGNSQTDRTSTVV